jgi:hypothetical protein
MNNMKKALYAVVVCFAIASCDALKVAESVLSVPTSDEAAGGLKDALKQGFSKGADALSVPGAFKNNNAIKIFLPADAQKVADKLRTIPGMAPRVDDVIAKLNEGAENAVQTAKPIFVDAVTKMTFNDAMKILTGGNGAATNYLKQTTSESLRTAFRPKIQEALDKIGVTKNWTELVNHYNSIPFVTKMNPDLNAHVTEKAMAALFNKVEEEENAIRSNPAQRTTELMKKAFNYADNHKPAN